MRPEDRRQLIHAAATVFALLLRWLTPTQAALLAGGAVVANWVVLPLTGLDRGFRREGGPWIDGVKMYPVAVLAVVLLFRDHLGVAAAAWAVLGIGDAASNVIGRRLGKPPFLGRADRSEAGTLAFILTAAPAAFFAYAFVESATPGTWVAAGAAAIAGAFAELVTPRRLDDNLPICLAAGAAFWALL